MRRVHSPLAMASLFVLASCAAPGLERVMLEASELHPSLSDRPLAHANHGVPFGVRSTPHLTTDPKGIDSIAGFSSQGRLDGDGLCAGLWTALQTDRELGYYGLQCATDAHADEREARLREIWKFNVRHERARVHRNGRLLLVVWHDGVDPACWNAVNDVLVARLAGRSRVLQGRGGRLGGPLQAAQHPAEHEAVER